MNKLGRFKLWGGNAKPKKRLGDARRRLRKLKPSKKKTRAGDRRTKRTDLREKKEYATGKKGKRTTGSR